MTKIHPTNYEITRKILETYQINIVKDSKEDKESKLSSFNLTKFSKENNIGEETLKDIIESIKEPLKDIRDDVTLVKLEAKIKSFDDLKIGQIVEGTIRNIVDFGLFIDINVHQDGLCHIKNCNLTHYVKDLNEVFKVNQIVKVKIIELDKQRKRIGLSLKID